jgi:hypothetical protein
MNHDADSYIWHAIGYTAEAKLNSTAAKGPADSTGKDGRSDDTLA